MGQWLVKIYLAVVIFVSILVLISGGFLFWGKNVNLNFEKKSDLSLDQRAVLPTDLPRASNEAVAEKTLKIVFFGDLMLDRDVALKIKQKGLDYLFEKIKNTDLFKNKDIISGNLEGALTDGGQHYLPNYSYDFAFSPETVGQLKNYGFNFFNLANNHIADQGQRGVSETRTNLGNLGFDYSGCPDGQAGDCSSKIVELKNRKIGLVGFSSVYQKLNEEQLKKIITDLKSKTDLVIVNMHWGFEYQHQFGLYQQELAHILIDSGADIVIGHHPHVIQGVEIYKGKPIFYSLGNFIFDQYFSADTQEGLVLMANLNNKEVEFLLVPLESRQSQVSLMTEQARSDFLTRLVKWSGVSAQYSEQIGSGRLILTR